MATTTAIEPGVVRSLIPARVDRLPWSRSHTRLVMALGVAWVLDGLEITVASSVAGALAQPNTLNMSSTAVGAIATVYLAGEVVGALVFGRLSDRLGRRNLFMVTLGVYLIGSGLTALTLGNGTGWVIYLYATRFIAGTGIGGEYAAINSAIDEMIPARYRGRVDVAVNGTYWAGAILGTLGALLFLHVLAPSLGWRIGFLIGPAACGPAASQPPWSPPWLLSPACSSAGAYSASRCSPRAGRAIWGTHPPPSTLGWPPRARCCARGCCICCCWKCPGPLPSLSGSPSSRTSSWRLRRSRSRHRLPSKVFTAVISLLSGVARSAIRNGRVAGPAPAPRSR
jgi:MFS family permease